MGRGFCPLCWCWLYLLLLCYCCHLQAGSQRGLQRSTKRALILEASHFFSTNHFNEWAVSVVMYIDVVAPQGVRDKRKDKLLCRVRSTRIGQELPKQLCCWTEFVINMPLRKQNIAAWIQEQAARLRKGQKLLNQLHFWRKMDQDSDSETAALKGVSCSAHIIGVFFPRLIYSRPK